MLGGGEEKVGLHLGEDLWKRTEGWSNKDESPVNSVKIQIPEISNDWAA